MVCLGAKAPPLIGGFGLSADLVGGALPLLRLANPAASPHFWAGASPRGLDYSGHDRPARDRAGRVPDRYPADAGGVSRGALQLRRVPVRGQVGWPPLPA